MFVPLLQRQFPEISDFHLPPEGYNYRMALEGGAPSLWMLMCNSAWMAALRLRVYKQNWPVAHS